ncbi:MAG: hypothetical protein H6R44_477, partial [Nitrospirae bacterium]|nr:hypothetical protein [Nitrospirota bacterium]
TATQAEGVMRAAELVLNEEDIVDIEGAR